jgi:hypothetical protein
MYYCLLAKAYDNGENIFKSKPILLLFNFHSDAPIVSLENNKYRFTIGVDRIKKTSGLHFNLPVMHMKRLNSEFRLLRLFKR